MNIVVDWNLLDLYKTEAEAKKDFELIVKLTNSKLEFKNKLNKKENILKLFKLEQEIDKKTIKLLQYLGLRQSLNGKDTFSRELQSSYEYFIADIEPKLSFIMTELLKNSTNILQEYALLPEFSDFSIDLKDLIEEKKHILNEQVRKVLSQNTTFGTNSEIFDSFNNVDLKFGKVETSNGEKELTHATYGLLIKDNNQSVRKAVYEKMFEAYGNYNYTLGGLYLNDVKETVFFSKIHKYKSVLNQSCHYDKTNEKVFSNLIKAVNDNLNKYHKFNFLKKKYFDIKNFNIYDLNLDAGKMNKKFSYEESVTIVLEALSVLGENYIKILKQAFTAGWIDVYEKDNKTSGGFCAPIYGEHPYILLNHNETFSDVSAIAHELGHAVNEYLSSEKQPINKSNVVTFIAEVASTVNEILLKKYMINKAKDKNEKLYYINELLKEIVASVYSQTMYSEFENYVYSSVENQENILIEDLNNKWFDLLNKYYGKDVSIPDVSKFGWSQIPHFYRPYYVYKYATGCISACIIASNILSNEENYLDKYFEFLSAGASVEPIELLKTVGVDFTKTSTINTVFNFFDELLKEYEELTKEK